LGLCDASGQVVYQHSHPWPMWESSSTQPGKWPLEASWSLPCTPGAPRDGASRAFPHEGDRPRLEFARAAMGRRRRSARSAAPADWWWNAMMPRACSSVSRATAASSPVPPTPVSWPRPCPFQYGARVRVRLLGRIDGAQAHRAVPASRPWPGAAGAAPSAGAALSTTAWSVPAAAWSRH